MLETKNIFSYCYSYILQSLQVTTLIMDVIKAEDIKVEEQFLHRHWVRNAATITRIWQTCDNNKYSQKDPSQQEHLKYITYGVRMSPGCLDFDKRRLCVITGLTRWTSDGSKLMRNWIALKWKVWITTKFPASHLAEKKWHTTELAFWERQYFCASDKKQDFFKQRHENRDGRSHRVQSQLRKTARNWKQNLLKYLGSEFWVFIYKCLTQNYLKYSLLVWSEYLSPGMSNPLKIKASFFPKVLPYQLSSWSAVYLSSCHYFSLYFWF